MSRVIAVVVAVLLALSLSNASAAVVLWDAGSGTDFNWATLANWGGDIAEPLATDDVIFVTPIPNPGTLANPHIITLTTGRVAQSLTFRDSYTLTGGDLTLGAGGPITVATGSTATISSALIGSNGLTLAADNLLPGVDNQLGGGTLVLSGTNTYSGATAINAGVLSISASANLGDATATNTLAINGGTLQWTGGTATDLGTTRTLAVGASGATINTTGAGALTLSGLITGSAALNKTGAGTLVLSAANTGFTGAVNANGGTLSFTTSANLGDGSATNSVGISNGGTLLFGGTNATVDLGSARVVTVGTGGGTIDTGASTNVVTISGVLAGGVGNTLTKLGTGTLTLSGATANTFAGKLLVNAGVVSLSKSPGTDAIAGEIDVTPTNQHPVIRWTSNNQVKDTAAITLRGLSGIGGGHLDLAGYSDAIGGLTIINNQGTTGINVYTGTGTLTLLGNVSVSGTSTAASAPPAGTNAAPMTGNAIGTAGGFIDLGTGVRTFDISATGNAVINANIIGAAGGILKTGTTNLQLRGTGSSNFAGGLTVTGGLVDFQSDSQLGGSSNVITLNGAGAGLAYTNATTDLTLQRVLNIGASGGTIAGSRKILQSNATYGFVGSSTITKAGTNALTLSAANAGYSGTWNVTGGQLEVAAVGALGTATNNVTVAGGEFAVNSTVYPTWSQNITANGGTISATGGNVTFSGNINVGGNFAFGLRDYAATSTARNVTLTGNLVSSAAGNVSTTGGGVLTLSGDNTGFTGNFVGGGGTMVAYGAKAINSGSKVTFTAASTFKAATFSPTATVGGTPGFKATYYNDYDANLNTINFHALDRLYLFNRMGGTRTEPNANQATNSANNYYPPSYLAGSSTSGQGTGVLWQGVLDITTAGSYTFSEFADDRATLFIDGTQIIHISGASTTPVTANLNLAAGAHSIVVRFANSGTIGYHSLSYQGADTGGSLVAVGSVAGKLSNGSLPTLALGALSISGGNGTVDLIQPHTYTSLNFTTSNSLITTSTTLDTLTVTGNTVITSAINPTFAPTSAKIVLQGAITGAGTNNITMSGPYQMEIQGNNTYAGSFTVTNGELDLNSSGTAITGALVLNSSNNSGGGRMANVKLLANNQIADTSIVTVQNLSVLDLNGKTDTIANLKMQAQGLIMGAGTLTVSDLGGANSLFESGAVLANLAGAGGLNKTLGTLTATNAPATLVLGGNNTYTGVTAINAGMLRVIGGGNLGATGTGNTTTIATGATLQLLGGAAMSGEDVTSVTGTGATPWGTNTGAIWNVGGANALGTVTLAGNATMLLSGGTLTVAAINNSAASNLTIDGAGEVILNSLPAAGTGTLIKNGGGTLTFNTPITATELAAIAHNAGTIGFKGTQSLNYLTIPAGRAYKFYDTPDSSTFIDVPAGAALINGGPVNPALLGRLVTSSLGAFVITQDSSTNLDFSTLGLQVSLGAQGLVTYSGAITPNYGYRFTGLPAGLGETIVPNRLSLTQALAGGNSVYVTGGGLDLTRLNSTQTGDVAISGGANVEILNNQNLGFGTNAIRLSEGSVLTLISNGTNLNDRILGMLGNPLSGGRRVVYLGEGGGTIDVAAIGTGQSAYALSGDFSNNTGSNPLVLYGAPTTTKLTKTGLGSLYLTNASNFEGTLEIAPNGGIIDLRNQGTLTNAAGIIVNTGGQFNVLSDGAIGQGRQIPQVNIGDRVADGIPITLQGGRLMFDAKNQGFNVVGNAETFGTVTLGLGQSEIRAERSGNGGADLIISNLVRQTGGTVRFTGETTLAQTGDNGRVLVNQIGSVATVDNQFLGGWAVVNSADFGVYKTQASPGASGGVINYGATVTGLTIPGYTALTTATAPGANGWATGNVGSAAADVNLGTPGAAQNFVVGALRLTGAANRNIRFLNNQAADTLYVESGGILSDGSNNARYIGSNAAGAMRGRLTAGTTGATTPQELYLHNNSNTTTIYAQIIDNPNNAAATVALVKDLDGQVTLNPIIVRSSVTVAGTTVTVAGGTGDLAVGMRVSGTGVPAGATILSITDTTRYELSAAATAGTNNLNYNFDNTYTGGTYVARGTLEGAALNSLGAGPVTVKNSRLNINVAGTINAAAATGGFTAVDNGEILLNNNTAAFTTTWDRFVVPAGSAILGPGASNINQGLNSLTRVSGAPTAGGQIQLAPGAIVAHSNVPSTKEMGIGSNTIKNLGQASDLWFGLAGTINDPLATVTIGTGTPWKGISTDRTARNWQQGTIIANSDFWLQGLLRDSAYVTLSLGATNAPGTYAIVNQAGKPINAFVAGQVSLSEETVPILPSDMTFVVTNGSVLYPSFAYSLGGNADITQNAKIRVLAGGTLDPAGYVPVGSAGYQAQGIAYPVGASPMNGLVTVEAGGRLLANDGSGLGSTSAGAWTIKTDGILELNNAQVLLGSTGGMMNTNQFVFEPGAIVRLREDVRIFGLNTYVNQSTGGQGIIFEAAQGDKTLTDAVDPRIVVAVGTATVVQQNLTLGSGGGLTNDASDRTYRARRGTVSMGNGSFLAATSQTILAVSQNMSFQSGANINIGSNRYIDGLPKQGYIRLNSPNSNTGDNTTTVTVLDGSQLAFNNYTVFPDAANVHLPVAPVSYPPATAPVPINGGATMPFVGSGSTLVLDSDNNTEFMGKLTGEGHVFSNVNNAGLAVGYGATTDFTFDGVIKNAWGTGNNQDEQFTKVGPTKLTLTNTHDTLGPLTVYQGEVSLAGANGRWGAGNSASTELRIAKGGILTFDNTEYSLTNRQDYSGGGNDWLTTLGGGEFRVLGHATSYADVLMFGLSNSSGTGIQSYNPGVGNSGGFGKVTVVPAGDLTEFRTSVTFNNMERFDNAGSKNSVWLVRGYGMGGLPGTYSNTGVYTPNAANPKDGMVYINTPQFAGNNGFGFNTGATWVVGGPGSSVVPVRGDLLASASVTATEGEFATIEVPVSGALNRTSVRPLVASEYSNRGPIAGTSVTVPLNVRAPASTALNYIGGDSQFQVLKMENDSSLNVSGTLAMLTQPAQVVIRAGGILVPNGATASISTTGNAVVRTASGVSAYVHAFGDLNVSGNFFSDTGFVKTGSGTVTFAAGALQDLRGRFTIHEGAVSINDTLTNTRNSATGASAFEGINVALNGGSLNLNGKNQLFNLFESGNILVGATTEGGTLTSVAPATVSIQGGGNFSGHITGAISLNKYGNNSLILTNTNNTTGTVAVKQGNLVLRDSGTLTGVTQFDLNYGRLDVDNGWLASSGGYIDRLKNGVAVNMRNGDFINRGRAGTLTQEHLGTVNVFQGNNLFQTISGGGGATETYIANLVRTPGAMVQFNQNNGFMGTAGNDTYAIRYLISQINSGAVTLNDGILPAWMNVNNDHFATYDPVKGISYLSNTEDGYANYSSTDLSTAGVTANVNDGTTRTIAASKTVNSIRFSGGANHVINSGVLLTVDTGGILANTSAAHGFTGAGQLTSNSGELNVFVHANNNTNNTMTIGVQITGNIMLTKAGNATLNLTGSNNYTGATHFSGSGGGSGTSGIVTLANTSANGTSVYAIPGDLHIHQSTVTESLPNQIKETANVYLYGGAVLNLRDAASVTETLASINFPAGGGGDANAKGIVTRGSQQLTSTLILTGATPISVTNDNPTSTPAIGQNVGQIGFGGTDGTAQTLMVNSTVSTSGLASAGLILNAGIIDVPTGVTDGGLVKDGNGLLILSGNNTSTFGNPGTPTEVFNIKSGSVRLDANNSSLGPVNAITTVQSGAVLMLDANSGLTGSIRLKSGATLGITRTNATLGAVGSTGFLDIPSGATAAIGVYDYLIPATQGYTLAVNHLVTGSGTVNVDGYQLAAGYNGGGILQLNNIGNTFTGTFNVNTNAILLAQSNDATLSGNTLGVNTGVYSTINLNGGTLRVRDQGDNTTAAQTIDYGNNVVLSADSYLNFDRQGSTATTKTIAFGTLTVPSGSKSLFSGHGQNFRAAFDKLVGPGTLVVNGNSGLDIAAVSTTTETVPSVTIAGPQGTQYVASWSSFNLTGSSMALTNLTVNGGHIVAAGKTYEVANTIEVGSNAGSVTNGMGLDAAKNLVPVSAGSTVGGLVVDATATVTTGTFRNSGVVGPATTGAASITATNFVGSGVYNAFGNNLTLNGTIANDGATPTTLKVTGSGTGAVVLNTVGHSFTGGVQVQSGALKVAPTGTGTITDPLPITGTIRTYGQPVTTLGPNSQPINQNRGTLEFAATDTITQNGTIVNNGAVRVSAGTVNLTSPLSGTTYASLTTLADFNAATVPGLTEGRYTTTTSTTYTPPDYNSNGRNLTAARSPNNGNFGITLEPRAAQTNIVTQNPLTGWTDNTTWIYTGYFYDADGLFTFAENIDDSTLISIDGVNRLLNNSGTNAYQTVTNTNTTAGQRGATADTAGPNTAGVANLITTTTPLANNPNLPEGWHTIEIRVDNGTGGGGPSQSNGFFNNYGLGYSPDIVTALDGSQYVRPIDNGTGNLFRTAVYGKGDVQVDAGATLNVPQITNTNKLSLGANTGSTGAVLNLNPTTATTSAFDALAVTGTTGSATLNGNANTSVTVGNFTGAGNTTLTNNVTASRLVITGSASGGTINTPVTAQGVTFNNSTAQTASTVISGSGGLIKQGGGTLNLVVPNTYDGSTQITAGTLKLGTAGSWGGTGSPYTNVPEAASFRTLYKLPIPNQPDFDVTLALPTGSAGAYSENHSTDGTIGAGTFNRVAYFLELKKSTDATSTWVWVSMDAAPFTTDLTKMGVPMGNNAVFHYDAAALLAGTPEAGQVVNMNVASNAPGITTGTGISTGNVEFWASNYGPANDYGVPGADGGTFDFGDSRGANTGNGHGSMQIFNYGAGQALISLSDYNKGTTAAGGALFIGNATTGTNPDGTFVVNTADYDEIKDLWVLVGSTAASGNILPITTDVVMSATTTLDLNNSNQSVMSITGPAGSFITLGTGTLTVTPALGSTTTFAGVISGDGSLVHNGAGTHILTGVNTYSGPTDVQAGKLVVNGSVTGAGAVTVASGATLGGAGSLAGAVALSGTLAPSTTGMTVGGLNLINNSQLTLQGTGGVGLINVTGALTLPGTSETTLVDVSALSGLTAGTPYHFLQYVGTPYTNGDIAGKFTLTGSLPSGYTGISFTTLGNYIDLTLTGGAGPITGTWSGGVSNVWSTSVTGNWTGTVPSAKAHVAIFPGSGANTSIVLGREQDGRPSGVHRQLVHVGHGGRRD